MSKSQLLNENQIKVLKAFFSTFIAELDENETKELISLNTKENDSSIISFAKFDLSSSPEFLEYFLKRLMELFPGNKISKIQLILSLLSSRSSSYLLTGYFKPFYELTRKQREQVIQKWAISSSLFRNIYQSFSFLVTVTFWLNAPKEITDTIGYPVIDPEINSKRFTSNVDSFPTYEFIEIPNEGSELNFDVVVIGSGAGGGVVAAELAKVGNSVLVLEKGKYYHQSELTTKAADGLNLYENKGVLPSKDGGVVILAGSTFGGGTVVNWSASLRPQDFLRKEWAEQGLDYFLSDEFNDALDYVERRMGVSSSQVIHSEQNKILIDGCKNLGIHYDTVPQNTGGHTHSCGWCCFGCRYGEKQSTLMTFLRDARDAGAKFIQDCYVEKILIKDGKAIGVKAIVSANKVLTVLAKKVIVSAGSIHSPALLLRSGINNSNIGKNLHLHPVCKAYGIFPDREVKGYNGPILTSLCSEKEDIDGNGYGVKIETSTLHPYYIAGGFPWKGSLHHKKLFLEFNNLSTLIVVARDKDGGNVFIDKRGNPRINYTLSKHDEFSLLQGVILALKILVAAGAKRVGISLAGIEDFVVKELGNVEERSFSEYLKEIEKIGLPKNRAYIATAHQMSSCRMGVHPSNSVVNAHGKVWKVDNLYVADASVFPTASGVNPMITTMGVAYSIAQFIKKNESQTLAKL